MKIYDLNIIKTRRTIKTIFLMGILIILSTSLNYLLQANKQESNLLSDNLITDIKNYDNYSSLDLSSEYLYEEFGGSSWYGNKFHNRKTASGELYDMFAFTAAHKKLPFGTILKVTNIDNNQATFVRVNDRGPFVRNRIIDLSKSAYLDMDGYNNPNVKIEGLLLKENNLFDNSKIEYYFGYSLTRPLVVLPYSNFKVIETIDNFDEAVEFYKFISVKNIDKNFYLIVPANEKKPTSFKIAVLDASLDENPIIEVAENN